jgi:hypothetical protein
MTREEREEIRAREAAAAIAHDTFVLKSYYPGFPEVVLTRDMIDGQFDGRGNGLFFRVFGFGDECGLVVDIQVNTFGDGLDFVCRCGGRYAVEYSMAGFRVDSDGNYVDLINFAKCEKIQPK